MTEKAKLPFELQERVVEVELRHVVLALGGLAVTALTLGLGLIIVKDYTQYRRQKILLDNIRELILIMQTNRKEHHANQTKRAGAGAGAGSPDPAPQ